MLFWCDLKFEKGEKELAKKRIRTPKWVNYNIDLNIYTTGDYHNS